MIPAISTTVTVAAKHVPNSDKDEDLLTVARVMVEREAQALANLVRYLNSSFVELVDTVLSTTGKVVTTGSGTSGIMAERLAHLLAVTGTPAFYLPCLDALHGGMGAVTPTDLVIALSKGGRSVELTDLTRRLVDRDVHVVAVTERPDSDFAAAATSVAHIATDPPDADIGSLIATGSTLVTGAWGDALTAAVMSRRRYSWADVIATHPAGMVGEHTGPGTPNAHAPGGPGGKVPRR